MKRLARVGLVMALGMLLALSVGAADGDVAAAKRGAAKEEAPTQKPLKASARRRFVERFDADGDGRLSAEEWRAARKFLDELRGKQEPPLPQTIFPGKAKLWKLEPGPHKLKTVETYLLKDAARKKVIPLRLTFPAEGGPYPLVIFCHGALGSKDGGQPLVTHWAAHGYVVIQPTFGDSVSLMTDAEKAKVRSVVDLLSSRRVRNQWDVRPRDVRHVLDSLALLAGEIDGLDGKIDAKRIVVAGHSFGAHTSMLIAGLQLWGPAGVKAESFKDDRVLATILISPQGTGLSIRETSYAGMDRPQLTITGDKDGSPMRGQEGKFGTWRRAAFDHSAAGEKTLLWITDAHHGFGGINGKKRFPGAGPVAPDHVLLVQSTCLAFLDAYAKGDAKAKTTLRGEQIKTESRGLAHIETR